MTPVLLAALGGVLAGLGFFAALRRNATLYLAGGPLWRPLALHGARLALLAALLVLVALRLGGLALLAAFAGVLAGRAMVLRA